MFLIEFVIGKATAICHTQYLLLTIQFVKISWKFENNWWKPHWKLESWNLRFTFLFQKTLVHDVIRFIVPVLFLGFRTHTGHFAKAPLRVCPYLFSKTYNFLKVYVTKLFLIWSTRQYFGADLLCILSCWAKYKLTELDRALRSYDITIEQS